MQKHNAELRDLEHPYVFACMIACKVFGHTEIKVPDNDFFANKEGNEDLRMLCAAIMRRLGVHDYYINTILPDVENISDLITSAEAKRLYDSAFDEKMGEAEAMADSLKQQVNFAPITDRENLARIIQLKPRVENDKVAFSVIGASMGVDMPETATEVFCFPENIRKGYIRIVGTEIEVTPEFMNLFPPVQYFLLRSAYHILNGRFTKLDNGKINPILAGKLALVDCHRKGLDVSLLLTLVEDYHLQIGVWNEEGPEMEVMNHLWEKAQELGYDTIFDTEVDGPECLFDILQFHMDTNPNPVESGMALRDLYERLDLNGHHVMNAVFEHLCGKPFNELISLENELLPNQNEENMPSCAICGHPLTDKDSIRRGVGPDCWAKMQAKAEQANKDYEMKFFPYNEGEDIFVKRMPDGKKHTNVQRSIVHHSTTDYEWGYGGSGPAELALNCMIMFCNYKTAWNLHQAFKEKFVAALPTEGGTIKYYDIQQFIADNTRDLFTQK